MKRRVLATRECRVVSHAAGQLPNRVDAMSLRQQPFRERRLAHDAVDLVDECLDTFRQNEPLAFEPVPGESTMEAGLLIAVECRNEGERLRMGGLELSESMGWPSRTPNLDGTTV